MPVYTRRFAGHFSSTPSSEDIFVADGAYDYVVRDICFNQYSAADALVSVVIRTGGGELPVIVHDAAPPNQALHWVGRQALEAGDVLAASSAAAPWSVVVTGYRLTPQA